MIFEDWKKGMPDFATAASETCGCGRPTVIVWDWPAASATPLCLRCAADVVSGLSRDLLLVIDNREGHRRRGRPCWHGSGAHIEYVPTPKASSGAWVDVGTQTHHRCKKGETSNHQCAANGGSDLT